MEKVEVSLRESISNISKRKVLKNALFDTITLKGLSVITDKINGIYERLGALTAFGMGAIIVEILKKFSLEIVQKHPYIVLSYVAILIISALFVLNVLKYVELFCKTCSSNQRRTLFRLSQASHDVVHEIRDSLEEEGRFVKAKIEELKSLLENEIQHILDRCQRYFSQRYGTSNIVSTIMEVNSPSSPEFMITKYYSGNASIERKKYRSFVSEHKGEVAGKFLKIAALKEGGKGHEEMEPIIWNSEMLEREKYIEHEHNNKDLNHQKIKETKENKFYNIGISSPFFVNQRLRGCINVDCLKEDIKTGKFFEEDKETLKFFGDACALIYEIMELVETLKRKDKELTETKEKLEEFIQPVEVDTSQILKELDRL